MFKIYSIGEGLGDCFLILLGDEAGTNITILVDGRDGSNIDTICNDISNKLGDCKKIDYLVVTHMDQDHIKGAILLMKTKKEWFEETKVIYNYVIKDTISYSQAIELESMLNEEKVINTYFDYYDCKKEKLLFCSLTKRKNFSNKIYELQKKIPIITFFSPNRDGVLAVHREYLKRKYKYSSGTPKKINKNSIVFLLEFKDKRALFTGDAYMDDISKLCDFLKEKIDVIKIPHHGAAENNKTLLEFSNHYGCKTFIVTGEKEWKKEHPAESLLKSLAKKEEANYLYTKVEITGKFGMLNIKKQEEIVLC